MTFRFPDSSYRYGTQTGPFSRGISFLDHNLGPSLVSGNELSGLRANSGLSSQVYSNSPQVQAYKRRAPGEEVRQAKRSKIDTALTLEERKLFASLGYGNIHYIPRNTVLFYMLQEKRRQRKLVDYYKRFVAVDKADKRECVAIVRETLKTIMDNVRSQPGGQFYSGNLLKAGSYAVKTKIGKADEFDWLVPVHAVAKRQSRVFSGLVFKAVSCLLLLLWRG